MNYRAIFRPLALVAAVLAAALLAPLGVALFEAQAPYSTRTGFAAGVLCCLLLAPALWFMGVSNPHHLQRKEGLLTVALGWTLAGLLGAIPFAVAGVLPGAIDAVFESVSGFTTTGASVLSELEALPASILLWRSLTHWLGGAGVVVLFVAVLPMLGISGKVMYQVETSGPDKSQLHPRISDTARTVWLIYVALTAAAFVLLLVGGMSAFDALNHAFSTLATGGFSTRSESIGAYNAFSHGVIIVFMFLAATNFALYYQATRGRWLFLRDAEFRFYALLTLCASLVVFATLQLTNPGIGALGQNLQDGLFGVVSMQTSTGFASANYELWHPLAQGVILLVMLVGGSAGSTTGAIKCVRVLITLRIIWRYMLRLFRPQAVMPIRVGGRALSRSMEEAVAGFVLLYIAWLIAGSLVMLAGGHDMITSISASIACLGVMGPGFGAVGPLDNYAGVYDFGKLFLTLQMIAGRLELMAISVLLVPSFWRR